jgi:putative glutamine amidotransferase
LQKTEVSGSIGETEEGVIEVRPLIGISCHFILREGTRRPSYGNNQAYVNAIEDAGGTSVLIPFTRNLEELENILLRLDGLLLPGGADIRPHYYNEEPRGELKLAHPELDELEFSLTRYALQRDMPIFGICRGMQALNIALGGNLYQDIADECPGSMKHAHTGKSRSELVHNVYLERQSFIASLLETPQFAVNSLHHQAIKIPGEGVNVVGRAEDGTVEAIEVEGYRFVMGLQCHPEEIYAQVPACAKLFQAFVAACAHSLPTPDLQTSVQEAPC